MDLNVSNNNNEEADATQNASGIELFPTQEKRKEKAEQAPSPNPKGDSSSEDATTQLQESVERLQLRDKRLSGAAKKRYRWLVKNGMPAEQAIIKAAQPMDPKDKGTKRSRSDGSTPEMASKKPKVVGKDVAPRAATAAQERIPPAPSFRQALGGKKVGILHKDYPSTSLTADQMKAVQEAILMKIVNREEGTVSPQFLGSNFRAGWISFTCADEATANWLKECAETLVPWEGASLKAAAEGELPKATIVNAYFPHSAEDNNDKILKLIKGQNNDLNTAGWRILKRTQEGAVTHLTMSVDESSLDFLKKKNYKVSFKFGQTAIRPKSAGQRPPVVAQSRVKPIVTTKGREEGSTPVVNAHDSNQGKEQKQISASKKTGMAGVHQGAKGGRGGCKSKGGKLPSLASSSPGKN